MSCLAEEMFRVVVHRKVLVTIDSVSAKDKRGVLKCPLWLTVRLFSLVKFAVGVSAGAVWCCIGVVESLNSLVSRCIVGAFRWV